MEITDVFEPTIEGMEKIEQKRRVTAMDTILSKNEFKFENEEDKVGYQKPEPKEEKP